MIAFLTPIQPLPCSGAKAMPQLWQYFSRLLRNAEAFYAACGFARGAENEQGVLMLRGV